MPALVALSLVAAACSSSDDDDGAADTTGAPVTTAAPDSTESTAADSTESTEPSTTEGTDERDVFVPISGVPGVTDTEISYAVIGIGAANPLGTCILDCYVEGIKAYFEFRNAEGGIYGRKLVVGEVLDDELAKNQVRALEVIAADNEFGTFNATLLPSGWADLAGAGIPNYVWGIHPANDKDPAIFTNTGAMAGRCVDCVSHLVPYAVTVAGATKVASLGLNATENSKVCAETTKASVDAYSTDIGAEVVYLNNELAFGLPNGIGPEVTAMKAAGVDFIASCLDMNSDKTLAQELRRQGMDDVPIYHPQGYQHTTVAEADGLFDGDFVALAFLPFEADATGTTLADFLEWMEKAGAEANEMAMTGWINASIAFGGLLAAGPEFDQATVIAATNTLTADTAGGLVAPIDWTTNHVAFTPADRPDDAADCMALVRIEDGAFVTVAPPETPWTCWFGVEWAEPELLSFT